MKKLIYLLSVIVTLSLSSCLDFLEQITVNKNGTGEYSMRVDATKFMEEMEAFAAMDSTGEMMPKMHFMLDSLFRSSADNYRKIKGIQNVKFDTSTTNVFVTTFSFDNFDALNEALQKEGSKDKEFEFSKNKLKRSSAFNNLALGDLMKGGGEEGQEEMMKQMFAEMKFTTKYIFPSKVKSVDNKKAVIADDKKSVTIESTFKELMDKTSDMNLEIKY